MKQLSALMICVGMQLLSYSQELIHKTIFSQFLQDTIKYNVWLPSDYNNGGHYPVVYLNSYAILGSNNAMLVAAHIHNFINGFPPTIVVDIVSGQMDKMDYSYQTGQVGGTGLQFIACLKNELIPAIEKTYHATQFRAFIGQSYSSSYANYLFLHQPGLFNAWLLLTPEQLEKNQPPFDLDDSVAHYYKTHTTFYYIAPAGLDLQRRKDYAEEIAAKLTPVDSQTFHFKRQLFPGADHNTILNEALLPGLQFIFSAASYQISGPLNNIPRWLDSVNNNRKNIYGIGIEKSSSLQIQLQEPVINQKKEADLDFLADYFNDTTSAYNYILLGNTGKAYQKIGNYKKAADYYKRSIAEGKRRRKPDEMNYGYINLILHIYWKHDKDLQSAWDTALQAFDDTRQYAYKFYMGKIAAEEGFKLDDGIRYLQEFIAFRKPYGPDINCNIDEARLLLAKCQSRLISR